VFAARPATRFLPTLERRAANAARGLFGAHGLRADRDADRFMRHEGDDERPVLPPLSFFERVLVDCKAALASRCQFGGSGKCATLRRDSVFVAAP
jgi:hypothetical protein